MTRPKALPLLRTLLLLHLLGSGIAAAGESGAETDPKAEGGTVKAESGTAAEPDQAARRSLPSPPGSKRPSPAQVQEMITEVAKQYGVERALVQAVVAAESNYNAHAVSPVGAVGLMQVMPATAGDYGVSSTPALFDPKTNLKTGTRHLKRLLQKYDNDYGRVIMAYNAGRGWWIAPTATSPSGRPSITRRR